MLDTAGGVGGMAASISEKNKERALDVLREDPDIVTIGQLAAAMGVHRRGLDDGRARDPEFKSMMNRLMQIHKGTGEAPPIPDFLEWRERFMGYNVAGQWVRAENYDVHRQAWDAVRDSHRLVMLIPPWHLKTSVWSIEYSTYLIMRDRNVRIMIVQKSQTEAKKIIRAVKERLTSHDFYQRLGIPLEDDPITLWGGPRGFKPEKYVGSKGGGQDGSWSATEFTVSGVTSGEKDPTMQAFGASSAILSIRADHILMDDIQAPSQRTPDVTDFLVHELIQQSIVTRIGLEQSLIILGSRLGQGDFYEKILSEDWAEDWPVVSFPAVLDEESKTTLLPEMWPYDKLMVKRKEVGEHTWATSYMQQEGDSATQVFSREAMNRAKDRSLRIGNLEDFGGALTHIYIGHDPAVVNWDVKIVWGLDKRTGQRFLLDVLRRRDLRTWERSVDVLCEAAAKYHPRSAVIEELNTQRACVDLARTRLASLGVQVITYKTSTGTGQQAKDQDFSISSVANLFDNDLVRLPYGDDHSRQITDAFVDECCSWYTTEDGRSVKKLVRDQVMATLFAESEAQREMKLGIGVPKRDVRRLRRFAHNGEGGWRRAKSSA